VGDALRGWSDDGSGEGGGGWGGEAGRELGNEEGREMSGVRVMECLQHTAAHCSTL